VNLIHHNLPVYPGAKGDPQMKHLNSIVAFALLVLVVAGCANQSNDNSKSNSSNSNSSTTNSTNTNSSNSTSSSNSSSNKSASSSSQEPTSEGEGVFHDDNAGIRLQAPKGWNTQLDGEQLLITAPDDSMRMVFWVPDGSFDTAIKDLGRGLSRKIKRMKTTTNGQESAINGMPTYTVAGTGQINGNDIVWSVDIIKAPKKPVIVLSFAEPGAWDKHSDHIKEFVSSIKPTA
jgi:outer membrane lipoprotein-sorting protein